MTLSYRSVKRSLKLPARTLNLVGITVAVIVADWQVAYSQDPKMETAPIPQLRQTGHATQLYVHDKPFLALGGELGNSTASDLDILEMRIGAMPANGIEHGHASRLLGFDRAGRRESLISLW